MNPQYPGYIQPNQPNGYIQQPVYGQQPYIQPQQNCIQQPQQPSYIQPQQGYQAMQPQLPVQQGFQTMQLQSPVQQGYQAMQPQSPIQQGYQAIQPQSPIQQGFQAMQPQSPMQQGYQAIQPQSPTQQVLMQPQSPIQQGYQAMQPQSPTQQVLMQPQQQCYLQQQQQPCFAQVQQQQQCCMPQQQCLLQSPQPVFVQPQPNYIQTSPQSYTPPQQQNFIQSQQEYDQPQQHSGDQQVISRHITEPQTRVSKINPITSSKEPIAYVSQSWNTSPIQQITGKPTGPVRPHFYYVFTPDMFTETNNPWTAAMWLHSFNTLPENMTPSDSSESEITKPEAPEKVSKPEISKPEQSSQQQKAQAPHRPQKPHPSEGQRVHIAVPSKDNNHPLKSESEIFKFESIDQFQKLRHHANIESALKQLNELATNLAFVNPDTFTPDDTSCFICCNSYVTPKYQLGVGPVNDAITVAANHKYMGYKVYFIHNQHHTLFLKFLSVFLQKTCKYLTVFFAGHGAQIKDTSGDEADGYDEVMVFDSGFIVDDDLAIYLQKYSIGKAHTILIADCCHSGTIWDIPEKLKKAEKFPANIMSISSSLDNQTSKQTEIQSNFQGVFTFNFWTLIRNRPSINIIEAQKILNREMAQFAQQIVMYPTRKEMLKKPIFPLMLKHHC
ncbi:hypothetical protein M9Y10_042369 [Tritrichomonas musculus]|uniref:Peptidase C14 caspase domain-containing protein n=1 Tax=Tritrichomonas musculus TaxID=1915356 RepID=A0ABR2GNZ9_9EUKA